MNIIQYDQTLNDQYLLALICFSIKANVVFVFERRSFSTFQEKKSLKWVYKIFSTITNSNLHLTEGLNKEYRHLVSEGNKKNLKVCVKFREGLSDPINLTSASDETTTASNTPIIAAH